MRQGSPRCARSAWHAIAVLAIATLAAAPARAQSTSSITGAVGGYVNGWLAERLVVRGDFLYIKVKPGDSEAAVTDWRLGADYYVWRGLGLGLQYKYNRYERPAEHGERANTLALFLGGTLETAEDETYFTLGLEYEREVSHRFAVMAVAEHVFDFDAWVIVAPVAFKPIRGLSLVAGPGLETTPRRSSGAEAEHQPSSEAEGDGPFFLWRFGIGYALPVGERFAVTPNVDLDLVREHGEWEKAWVFGVSLGVRF